MGLSFKGILGFIKNIALQAAGIKPIAEMVSVFYPKSAGIVNTFNQLFELVKQTEGIATVIDSDVSGEQKLTAATPYAVALIKGSEALANTNVVDEVGFIDGVKLMISGAVKILHSVQEPGLPAAVPPTKP